MTKSFKKLRESIGAGGFAGPPTNNISGGNIALYNPIMTFGNKKKKYPAIEKRLPPNNK